MQQLMQQSIQQGAEKERTALVASPHIALTTA
jgi:hypothetical protein